MNRSKIIVASLLTLVTGFFIGRMIAKPSGAAAVEAKASVGQGPQNAGSVASMNPTPTIPIVVQSPPQVGMGDGPNKLPVKPESKLLAANEMRRVTRNAVLKDGQAEEITERFAQIIEQRDALRAGTTSSERELLEGLLTEEQQKTYDQRDAARFANQIEGHIRILDEQLHFSETQKDQLFMLMARATAPHLSVQIADGSATPPSGTNHEEAFRNFLTPDQQTAFAKSNLAQSVLRRFFAQGPQSQ